MGCGYHVYVWPNGTEGGPKPDQNAFAADFTIQQAEIAGIAYTELMHATIRRNDGRDYHVAIVPAEDSPINLLGNHSSRGGSNARTTWSDSRPTQARLHYPLLRVGDDFNPIPWDAAIELQARVLKGILDKYGSDQLAAKIFDHGGGGGGMENTYGTGRLLFTGLQMVYTGIHNRPAYSSETFGTRDRGLHELNYTAQDARLADTIVLWGANSYDTATVFFEAHIVPNFQNATADEKKSYYAKGEPMAAARLVVVDPRATATVNAARAQGAEVLHIRPKLGTDYMLMNAVARAVWQKGYYNQAFLAAAHGHEDVRGLQGKIARALHALCGVHGPRRADHRRRARGDRAGGRLDRATEAREFLAPHAHPLREGRDLELPPGTTRLPPSRSSARSPSISAGRAPAPAGRAGTRRGMRGRAIPARGRRRTSTNMSSPARRRPSGSSAAIPISRRRTTPISASASASGRRR